MNKKIYVICILLCTICTSYSHATQNKIASFFETGERSVTDTIEDRDISGNYSFYKYYARFDQEASKSFKYRVLYELYHKDYVTSDNLDMNSNQVAARFDYWLSPDKLKVSLDAGYKWKDYKNSSSSEYERSNATIGLDYKYEDLWALGWDNGFINYDYNKSGGDQLKMFTRLGGWMKFFEERLRIAPSFKYQGVNQDDAAKKDRAEQVFTVSSYYKAALPCFEKAGFYYSFGKNDTKDYEEDDRDDDLRFKYQHWHVSTDHPLLEGLDTSFKYGQLRRNYQTSPNNYRTWFVDNKTSLTFYKDKVKKVSLIGVAEHREGDYGLVDSLNYIKNLIGGRLSCRSKDNWEFVPGFTFKKYDYTAAATKNEKQYVAHAEFTKEIPARDLELKLAYKYVWKDYEYKDNITQWVLRAGLEWKF